MLNSLLLIVCICIIIAILIYFFYLNRIIAWLIGLTLRFLYWRQGEYSIWVTIGSIHFSVLTGRILFKDIGYHSSNQTIKIVTGQIAWRYWIRRPLKERVFAANVETGESVGSCRVQITLQGFEWFIYNKTNAYESIISQMQQRSTPHNTPAGPSRPQSYHRSATTPIPTPSVIASSFKRHVPNFIRDSVDWVKQELPNLDPKDLLPLGLAVLKGSIIVGNASTPSLLVAQFNSAKGTYGIVPARSKYDLYRNLLNLDFEDSLIQYVQNEDFKSPMIVTGEIVQERMNPEWNTTSYLSYHTFQKLWRHLHLSTIANNSNSGRLFHTPHININRKSVEEDYPFDFDYTDYEYAIDRKLLEAPKLQITYYADVVGVVPPREFEHISKDSMDIGNGGADPEWGVDIVVRNGILRYGPWADRQRAELQRAFFPPTYHTASQTAYLEPGDCRVWTNLRVLIELRDETSLHVPFREASKNWQWDAFSDPDKRPKRREAAWLNLTAGDISSITYIMPMVAGPKGYDPRLEVHLDTVDITSSLNDMTLVQSESCRVHAEMPSPLQWNAERQWDFTVILRQSNIFLIRDHINMFTDLAKDWNSGPHTDFNRFVPVIYGINFELHRYDLHLYANDHNLIDKPLIIEENAIFTFSGLRLTSKTKVPSTKYRADHTSVNFDVDIPDVSLNLSLPRWNTNALCLPKDGNSLATIGTLNLKGSYLYFSEYRPENVEQLRLDLDARNVVFKALGWSIRYFMVLRDNYFGSFTHFSTLYEYLDRRRNGIAPGDPVIEKYRANTSNMMQVELFVSVRDGVVVVPAGMPGYEQTCTSTDGLSNAQTDIGPCTILTVSDIQVHLRLHDYYMEMSVNISTISASIQMKNPEKTQHFRVPTKKTNPMMIIDGIDITADRLFGPQPKTMTYVCIWELHVGEVRGILSATQASLLASTGKAFGINFSDTVNAPAHEYQLPAYPDVTFLKLCISSVELTWKADLAAVVFSLPKGLNMDNNDLGGQFHKKLTSLVVAQASLKILLNPKSKSSAWLEAAELNCDAYLDIYSCPPEWRDLAAAQASFVREQDVLTQRAQHLIDSLRVSSAKPSQQHRQGVFIPYPNLTVSDGSDYDSLKGALESNSLSRWPTVSDSDAEQGITESMRDARLAQQRSDPPLSPAMEPDEDMSSGDESDDDDTTADDYTDSEWSDTKTEDPKKASLRRYSRFVRHFQPRDLYAPSHWKGSPFILTKPSNAWHTPHFADRTSSVPNNYKLPLSPKDDINFTTFRFASRSILDLKITPLLVDACELLVHEIATLAWSPELTVDRMMAECLAMFSDSKQADVSWNVFDVSLPIVSIQIFQHIPVPAVNLANGSNGAPLPPGINTSIMLTTTMQNVHVAGSIQDRRLSLLGDVQSLHVRWDTILSISHDLLSIELEGLKIVLEQDDIDIELGHFDMQLGHQGPRYLAAFVVSMIGPALKIVSIFRKYRSAQRNWTKTIIHDIVHASNDGVVENLDPLSAIQPSYLVQTGEPYDLRTNVLFRFIFHLRNCLWHLRRRGKYSSSLPSSVSIDILKPLLEVRLDLLDPEAYASSQLYSLFHLIPDLEPPTELFPDFAHDYSPKYGSLRISSIRVQALDASDQMPNAVVVSGLTVIGRVKKAEILESQNARTGSAPQISTSETLSAARIVGLSVTTDNFAVTVYPHLVNVAQELLRTQRAYNWSGELRQTSDQEEQPSTQSAIPFSDAVVELIVSLRHFSIQAVAERLLFEFGIANLRLASYQIQRTAGKVISMNHSIMFSDIYIVARSAPKSSKLVENNMLASFRISGGNNSVLFRQEGDSGPKLRIVAGIEKIHLNVPRSALRLYQFVEEWRADFFPPIEATIREFLSEVKQPPSTPLKRPKITKLDPAVHIHLHIASFEVSLQIMLGTWLSLEIKNAITYANTVSPPGRSNQHTFGGAIECIVVSINSATQFRDYHRDPEVRMELPPMSISGKFDGSLISVMVLVEFLKLKVKPSHWDKVVSVQQKFGQDFNDLLVLVQKTRRKVTEPVLKPVNKKPVALAIFGKMKGFRVGFEGMSSTLYLECRNIDGRLTSNANMEQAWAVTMSDLALSLASAASTSRAKGNPQTHRSAFVIIDFKLTGGGGGNVEDALQLTVTRIHAVMQPSSIGELGDFIDHIQAEMLQRQEQRKYELAVFKQRTQSILKSLDSNSEALEVPTFLSKYTINISLDDIGIAFPLAFGGELELPRSGSNDDSAVRAFLFSIKSVKFSTERGETGQATIQDLSFQFVSRFRQSVAKDFSGDTHITRNRLIYPIMTAQLRMLSGSNNSRQISMKATVSGFIVDLDSSIPDYIFSLIDVYRQGKERVSQLSTSIPRPAPSPNDSFEKQYGALPTSNAVASLTFLSGKVRMYGVSASTRAKLHTRDLSDEKLQDMGAEIFNLPVVSVWAEFRATPASHKVNLPLPQSPSTLMFRSTIHSSQNTLRPSLLPFLTELLSHIESRMRQAPAVPRHSLPSSPTVVNHPLPTAENNDTVSSMQISFSLRIDQSKLELTCQPDVNVIAGLHWDSGGFIVTITPGARNVTFTGSVGGLTVGLKHGFLSEDCVKLDARNLAFSVTFAKMDVEPAGFVNSISLVLDTEFLGSVHFSRFQDVLCFKAVWLDRIPIFQTNHIDPPKLSRHPSEIPGSVAHVKNDFSTLLLIHIREIKLEIDLGQSISTVTLDFRDSLLRTKFTQAMSEVSISVSDVIIIGKGNIAGQAQVSNCVFHTTRLATHDLDTDKRERRMLELRMTSGALTAMLESDRQKLLHYRAEPLEIEIFDNWATVSPNEDGKRSLWLFFTVNSPQIVALATIQTIPKLMLYASKFKVSLEQQRHGASLESDTFRATRAPKPDNPLSAVAEAMIHSARTRFKEVGNGLCYVVHQRMTLRLSSFRLVVFTRAMMDMEAVAQFTGRNIHARLDRVVGTHLIPATRDIRLAFDSLVISKFATDGPSKSIAHNRDFTEGTAWLDDLLKGVSEATIIGLPAMTMHMASEETIEDNARVLLYDFYTNVVRHSGTDHYDEDIYITLNVGLYSWLTILRKNLSREMAQAKVTADWRTSMNTNVPQAITGRRKVLVDLSDIPELPKSASLPRAGRITPSLSSRSATTSHPPYPLPSNEFPYSDIKETGEESDEGVASKAPSRTSNELIYRPRKRNIEKLTMRQLGDATPNVMHPFFMKKAGFSLEDSLPQYVNEYATAPLEEIMEVLLKLYSKQLLASAH